MDGFPYYICSVSSSIYFLIETNVLIVSFLTWAQQMLRRQRQYDALAREALRRFHNVYYHRFQDRISGSSESPHYLLGRFELARLHRTRDEQHILQTGKNYWQLHDLETTAHRMRDLEKARSPELPLMWERIPTSAIPKLYERMTELRRAEERTRDQANIAALDAAYAAAVEANKRGDTSVLFFGAPLAPQFRG